VEQKKNSSLRTGKSIPFLLQILCSLDEELQPQLLKLHPVLIDKQWHQKNKLKISSSSYFFFNIYIYSSHMVSNLPKSIY